MKSTAAIALLAGMSTTLAGCEGVVWGNVAMLGVTVCLFFGTLSLGRTPGATPSSNSAKPTPATRAR